MRTGRLKRLLAMAVAGACLSPAAALRAEDAPSEGLVRVADHEPAALEPIPEPAGKVTPVSGPVIHEGPIDGGPGHSHHGTYHYHTPLGAWLSHDDVTTYSPGHGWSRPVKRRMYNQVPVQYYRYWPDVWYGMPGAFTGIPLFPQVYMPTDTTQLGYTYQRVPTWQPNPGMIPPPPWPPHWHRREYPGYGYPHGDPYQAAHVPYLTGVPAAPAGPAGVLTPATPPVEASPEAADAPAPPKEARIPQRPGSF